MKTIVGLYDKRDDAQNAIEALVNAGFSRDRISMAAQSEEGEDIDMHQGDRVKEYDAGDSDTDMEHNREAGNEAGEGAAVGGTVGAVLGGIGGLLLGLGTLAIPGLGVIAAAGPLAGLLTGALAGGVAGGIVGALVGLGIPEEEAEVYAEGVRRGGTLVAVQTTEDRTDAARTIMERYNPVNIERRSEQWEQDGWEGGMGKEPTDAMAQRAHQPERRHMAIGDEETIERDTIKEEWRGGQRKMDRGGVKMHSFAESEEVTQDIPVRREHVDVERVEMERHPGDRNMQGAIDQYVTEHEQEYRQHYQTQLSKTGRDFSYFRPAYTYGCRLANADQYRDRDWSEIEADARRRWSESNDDESWFIVEDAVRTSFNSYQS